MMPEASGEQGASPAKHTMKSKLVVTGFMGTGKSAVGRAVAARLGRRFIDSDHEIVARAGKSIGQLFIDEGEAAFRAMERAVIRNLAQSAEPAVIATGGGVMVDEENFKVLAPVAAIILLTARPEVIARRVSASAVVRPKLMEQGLPLAQAIARLMEQRAPAYARIKLVIDTSDLTIDEAADRVISLMET